MGLDYVELLHCNHQCKLGWVDKLVIDTKQLAVDRKRRTEPVVEQSKQQLLVVDNVVGQVLVLEFRLEDERLVKQQQCLDLRHLQL